ncbi:MAG: hypothetical protein J5929_09310 [Eubacterium sp.]|nr:hypothetical protein [Eubacterium sp.]
MRHPIRTRLKLSEQQYEALDLNTRRSMIQQLMFIETPKHLYCIGTQYNKWTIVRYDLEPEYKEKYGRLVPTGEKFTIDETAEIVDRWN